MGQSDGAWVGTDAGAQDHHKTEAPWDTRKYSGQPIKTSDFSAVVHRPRYSDRQVADHAGHGQGPAMDALEEFR